MEKAWAAWLKIEPGSLASVQRDGADGMKDLGAGGLSAFPVLSATLTLPPPPTFSRWGGAEVWVQVDSPFPPIFFFYLDGCSAELICSFYQYPRDKGERIVWFFGV